MSLNMATSLPAVARVESPAPAAPAANDEPEAYAEAPARGSLGAGIAAFSSVLLLIVLAGVVFVGQRRIGEFADALRASNANLEQERAGRADAEQKVQDLSAQIADLDKVLRDRELSLDKTRGSAAKLKESAEKEKSQLSGQLTDTESKLVAAQSELERLQGELQSTKEDLDDVTKANEQNVATVTELQGEVASQEQLVVNLKDDRTRLQGEVEAANRKMKGFDAENQRLKGEQVREQAAVKKLLVQMTQVRQESEKERAWRQSLEAQLRAAGITPKPAPLTEPSRPRYEDEGDVGERDLR